MKMFHEKEYLPCHDSNNLIGNFIHCNDNLSETSNNKRESKVRHSYEK